MIPGFGKEDVEVHLHHAYSLFLVKKSLKKPRAMGALSVTNLAWRALSVLLRWVMILTPTKFRQATTKAFSTFALGASKRFPKAKRP